MYSNQIVPRDICIVDSHPHDYARLLADFDDNGMVFHFATTAEAALRLRVGPDAVWLVNFRLPDATGTELHDELRERGSRAVFVVSDCPEPTAELAARLAGAACYVVKPADPRWLAGVKAPRFAQKSA